jgi:hypothetical protein
MATIPEEETNQTKTVMGFVNSASSYTAAEEQAKAEAESVANDIYGVNGWTQTSFAQVRVKENTDLIPQKNGTFKEVVTGYTGTYELKIAPIAPPTPEPEPDPVPGPATPGPVDVQESVFDPGTTFGGGEESVFDPGTTELPPIVITAPREPPLPDPPKDWRVRISLAREADYLYKAKPNPGILYPLVDTDGVVFPYTPTIQLTYNAKYDTNAPTHSNYTIHAYQGSSVEAISITGEFTAQSIYEANYLLAVIHFFRSATKMFYGQDANRGVPPPLLYLSGYGNYQFDHHPMVLQSFTYTLPPDVDYVDAYSKDTGEPGITQNGISLSNFAKTGREIGKFAALKDGVSRLLTGKTKLATGGKAVPSKFTSNGNMIDDVTRVPTKITIALTLLPIVTRNAISNKFSLKEYSTGKLLRGSKNQGTGGGIW